MDAKLGIIAIGMMMAATPSAAQDAYNPAPDHSAALLQQRLADQNMNYQNRRRSGRTTTRQPSTRARATCANKGRAAARLGRDHPDVRSLYALCARAGY